MAKAYVFLGQDADDKIRFHDSQIEVGKTLSILKNVVEL